MSDSAPATDTSSTIAESVDEGTALGAETAEACASDESGATGPMAEAPTASAPPAEPAPTASGPAAAGDLLEELTLPSLIQAPPPLPTGTVLGPDGRVTVVEHLGTRGRVNRYAATWRDDAGTGVPIELREGPADQAGPRCEADILASVRYAMLPARYAAFEDADRFYLAIDRLDGETLAQALRAGLEPERAISVVLQLVQVVRRLHAAGWAIPGLGPADVLLGQPVRLAQLGHAERIGAAPARGLHVAGYSAPELAHGEPVTGLEDVYALGAILYHALAGHPLPETGAEVAELSLAMRTPGGPQLLSGALAPVDERLDLDGLYRGLLALKGRLAAAPIALEVASATSVGLNPTRQVNEDSCGYASWSVSVAEGVTYRALLCVADGMGGMDAGEVASRAAVTAAMQGAASLPWFPPATPGDVPAEPAASRPTGDRASERRANGGQATGAGAADDKATGSGVSGTGAVPAAPADGPPPLDPVTLVRAAAPLVHAAGQGRNMGTTCTLVAVQDGVLTLGHVGDTRAYLLRDGTLTQLTADHSLVAAMVASGVITKEEAQGHPDSNKVLRSLGSQRELPNGYVDNLEAAYGQPTLQLRPRDWLVLCSDGVWGSVPDAEIRTIATEAFDPPTVARLLVERALAAGAPDNAVAVVARCVRVPSA